MRLIFIIISYFFLQFANKISEKLLGYRINELWGKNITDLILYDNFIQMEQHIVKGREYDGNINCIRRNNQMLTINCRVIPFAYFKWVKLDLSFKKKKRKKKKKNTSFFYLSSSHVLLNIFFQKTDSLYFHIRYNIFVRNYSAPASAHHSSKNCRYSSKKSIRNQFQRNSRR